MTSARVFHLFALFAFLTACVPARKYEELNSQMAGLRAESETAMAKAREAEAAYSEQQGHVGDVDRRVKLLEQDTFTMGTSLRKMQSSMTRSTN
ncbi:MAG: hypothetical protein IPK99_12130 [Flavobacteriales bacterium]|nr:hypothetical protein [Flavobacteriales bacterium]